MDEGGTAPGRPGIEPRWSGGAKQAVGTALTGGSRVWFTIAQGTVTEVYFPSPDMANTRDLQLLITGPGGLFLEQRRDLAVSVASLDPHAPAYALSFSDPAGRLSMRQRVLTAPDADCLLLSVDLDVPADGREAFRAFALLAPHVKNRGYGNSAEAGEAHGRRCLFAWREDTWLCLMTDPTPGDMAVTYSGPEDAYWDIRQNGRITRPCARAEDGNLALAAELAWASGTVRCALGFGRSRAEAAFAAHRTLVAPEATVTQDYGRAWRGYLSSLEDLAPASLDGGHLLRSSARVLRTHMDKRAPGAVIASLAIPWGYACGDQNTGGYHLIWTRDLYEAASGLLALGDSDSARRCLLYMASIQRPDGSWPQNGWLDGTPYWPGSQLDEVAFPVILAYRLEGAGALGGFDPWPMARAALAYLLRSGPDTPQERWEEDAGYSPSTMAAELSALVVGAEMADERKEAALATLLRETADAWFALLEKYASVSMDGVAEGEPYYVRIAPVVTGDDIGGDLSRGFVPVRNLPPGAPNDYPIGDVIDGGFLELVRFGVKRADDPLIVNTVALYDRELKVETPHGDVWHRYNHDGYGEKADGSAYDGSGIGRAWPLLTGERGHYELALGRSADAQVRTLERIGGPEGLLPEQVWDADDIPERHLFRGEATGSARPLVWAHAEYVKLLRSKRDGRVFDRLEPVARHFAYAAKRRERLVVWAFARRVGRVRAGDRLRLWLLAPAVVHWTRDAWRTVSDETTVDTGTGVHILDLRCEGWLAGTQARFTFLWTESGTWEGTDFAVDVTAPP